MADTVTVVYGEETFNVGNYSGFRCGPYSVTLEVKPGETHQDAIKRGWDMLEGMANTMFLAKRNAFHERNSSKQ